MAARTAISRRRPVARTSSRLATLAQAMSSTKLTAPTSTSSDERTLLTSASRIGIALEHGVLAERVGKLRPCTRRGKLQPRIGLLEGDARRQTPGHPEVVPLILRVGIELKRDPDFGIRARAPGSRTLGSSTPMTVYGLPLSEIVLPMTSGSLPKRRVQT